MRRSCHPTDAHTHIHFKKKTPKKIQLSTFHHSLTKPGSPSFFPTRTHRETQGQWRSGGTVMNGCEGCHPGQTEPGPTCCYILKNMPVTPPAAEGNSLEVSHILSIAHSVSLSTWNIHILSFPVAQKVKNNTPTQTRCIQFRCRLTK